MLFLLYSRSNKILFYQITLEQEHYCYMIDWITNQMKQILY